VICDIEKPDGSPELWIMEVLDPNGKSADPLALSLQPFQFPEDFSQPPELPKNPESPKDP